MTSIPTPDFPTPPTNPNTVGVTPDAARDLGHTAVSTERVRPGDIATAVRNMGDSDDVDRGDEVPIDIAVSPANATLLRSPRTWTPERLQAHAKLARGAEPDNSLQTGLLGNR